MGIVDHLIGRLRSTLGRLYDEWDETDVVDSACCTPEHLLPRDGSPEQERRSGRPDDASPDEGARTTSI